DATATGSAVGRVHRGLDHGRMGHRPPGGHPLSLAWAGHVARRRAPAGAVGRPRGRPGGDPVAGVVQRDARRRAAREQGAGSRERGAPVATRGGHAREYRLRRGGRRQWSGGFSPGPTLPVYQTKIGRLGVVICYESAFEELARAYRRAGAAFLVNITNDAWYGRTAGPYQHASHLVLRAIETRAGIARAANDGIS